MAAALNIFENHKTKSAHEDHLIAKVNFYIFGLNLYPSLTLNLTLTLPVNALVLWLELVNGRGSG